MSVAELRRITVGALAAAALIGSPAFAQDKPAEPPGPPPSWHALMHCAETGDPAGELACYRAAMRDAGYVPTPEAKAQRRRRFGLAAPSLSLGHHGGGKPHAVAEAPGAGQQAAAQPASGGPASAPAAEEDDSRVTVQLDELALIPPANRMMLVTTDGAVWKQLDDEVVTPRPKHGQSFQIERNRFGGYFCRFDRLTKVRCERTH